MDCDLTLSFPPDVFNAFIAKIESMVPCALCGKAMFPGESWENSYRRFGVPAPYLDPRNSDYHVWHDVCCVCVFRSDGPVMSWQVGP